MKNVLRVFCVLSLAFVVSCGDDESNSVIYGISPNQVSIGQQNAVGTITGRSLNATAVSLGDGISVTSFTLKSSTEIEVQYNVSESAVPGPRNITLTTSAGNVIGNAALNVTGNKVPKAEFTISPSAGSLATTFQFDASGSEDQRRAALSFTWDFGDGSTASGAKVKHKYKELGTVEVTLKATDADGGFDLATKSIEVLKNSPPVPDFDVSPSLNGDTNTLFLFNGKKSRDPDGRVTDHIWDFDDGTRKKHGEVVEHQFEKPGDYNVSLTVVDNKGQLATDQKKLGVEKSVTKVCQGGGSDHPAILRGDVIAVEDGQWAIVDFGRGATCDTHWHRCDDFRLWGAEGPREFFGIVDRMEDRGNGILAVHNSCPYKWPPGIGDEVFLYFKTCSQNSCP